MNKTNTCIIKYLDNLYYNGFCVKQVVSSVMITLFNIVICSHLGFENVAGFFLHYLTQAFGQYAHLRDFLDHDYK